MLIRHKTKITNLLEVGFMSYMTLCHLNDIQMTRWHYNVTISVTALTLHLIDYEIDKLSEIKMVLCVLRSKRRSGNCCAELRLVR